MDRKLVSNLLGISEKSYYRWKENRAIFKLLEMYFSDKNIEEFLKLKQENTSVRTYAIFVDRLLWNYEILNNYNSKVLNVLKANKDIIIKNSYIVLPNSWGEILQDLNVLYSEKEWNSLNK